MGLRISIPTKNIQLPVVKRNRPVSIIDSPYERLSSSTKRQKRGQSPLCAVLDTIIEKVRAEPIAIDFVKLPSKQVAPQYAQVIAQPMTLSMMAEKINLSSYTSLEEFMDDMRLIVSNCHEYCQTRYPHMLNVVDNLYLKTVGIVQEHEAELRRVSQKLLSESDSRKILRVCLRVPKLDCPISTLVKVPIALLPIEETMVGDDAEPGEDGSQAGDGDDSQAGFDDDDGSEAGFAEDDDPQAGFDGSQADLEASSSEEEDELPLQRLDDGTGDLLPDDEEIVYEDELIDDELVDDDDDIVHDLSEDDLGLNIDNHNDHNDPSGSSWRRH